MARQGSAYGPLVIYNTKSYKKNIAGLKRKQRVIGQYFVVE
jgi:hypothetical protein